MSDDPILDPEGNEPSQLQATGLLEGSRVIELGFGDGRLTWRYAALPKVIVGVDPYLEDLQEAQKELPNRAPHTPLVCAMAENLPFKPKEFEVALFSWSL
jgi:ubiquinone/menaquinone biosynthesis C-methylase UbiE